MQTKIIISCLVLICSISCMSDTAFHIPENFDWQGHRGARGIMPENTIPAFIKALDEKMNTLEMDAAISKDGKVIISHEPWFDEHISTDPEGNAITDPKAHKIMDMSYEEIKQYDVGRRPHPRFPDQKKMAAYKPSLEELVKFVEAYVKAKNMPMPRFNIEIKSKTDWDDTFTPPPMEFAKILLAEIKKWEIDATIQSFDVRSLKAVRQLDGNASLVYLVENTNSFEENMKLLGFTPDVYSPYFPQVDADLVAKCKKEGMLLIPWTVNKKIDMIHLLQLGVDGIITDYPNRVNELKADQ